jgi:hypothetical protein
VSGQRHTPAALYPRRKNPRTHWTGGWRGPRAGLDAEAVRKMSASVEDRTPVVQSVVSHYTDWATSASNLHRYAKNMYHIGYAVHVLFLYPIFNQNKVRMFLTRGVKFPLWDSKVNSPQRNRFRRDIHRGKPFAWNRFHKTGNIKVEAL